MARQVTHDSQGRELAVGQRVAYNLSGLVSPGEIWDLQPTFVKIRCMSDSPSGFRDTFSRVRNGDSILVLDEG